MIELAFLLQIGTTDGANRNIMTMVMWGAILLVMYFFFFRPQSQKVKKEASFMESLQNGDKVVTKSGIHGKVVKVSEHTVLVQIADSVKIKMERSALSADMTASLHKGDA